MQPKREGEFPSMSRITFKVVPGGLPRCGGRIRLATTCLRRKSRRRCCYWWRWEEREGRRQKAEGGNVYRALIGLNLVSPVTYTLGSSVPEIHSSTWVLGREGRSSRGWFPSNNLTFPQRQRPFHHSRTNNSPLRSVTTPFNNTSITNHNINSRIPGTGPVAHFRTKSTLSSPQTCMPPTWLQRHLWHLV